MDPVHLYGTDKIVLCLFFMFNMNAHTTHITITELKIVHYNMLSIVLVVLQ